MNQLSMENAQYLIVFLGIIAITFILVFIVRKVFNNIINRVARKDVSDATNYSFFRYIVIALIYSIGFATAMYSVPVLRSVGNTLLAGAGVIALAVSFASQQALSNIISGLFIIIFKPFRIGDRVMFQGQTMNGIIEDITLRHTVVKDFENRRIIVPNTVISDEIIVNSDYKDDPICKGITIGISYDSDIDKAKNIIFEEATKHPFQIDRRSAEDIQNNVPEINVRVINLGVSSVDLKAWIWAKNQPDAFVMRCDLYESIKKRFDKEGIEIPYLHQVNIIKK